MRLQVSGSSVFVYTASRALDAARPTVVFVHGAAQDHSVWTLQARYFAHHGRNVLAVDLPGHGQSEGAPLASVEAIADWIAQVLDAAGIATAAAVGYSMGSLAVLECAQRYPARLAKIALLGIAAPMEVSDELMALARADDHVAFELVNGWSHSAGKQLGGNQVPGIWMTGAALRLMERSRPGVLHADLANCRRYANGIAAAAAVRCPALAVIGARDLMAPPKGAQALLEALAGVRVVKLPETGHAMMAEQPDAVLDALRGFL